MAEKKISLPIAIGVYAMYFMISGAGATTPAIAGLGAAYPDVPQATITMINTLPSLAIIVGTLFMGAVAGKKIPFKTAAIIALIIYLIFGIFPTFWHDSFEGILITRVICGLGMGLVAPLGAAVFTNLIADKEERSKYLGRGGAFQQIGCVVMTFVGGWLAAIDINYTWLAYLLCIPCLLLIAFCYKDTDATRIVASEDKPKEKIHIGGVAIIFIVIFFIAQMVCSPTMMNFSGLMASKIAGQSATSVAGIAGTLLSVFVLAGAVGSALLDKFIKGLGKFTGAVMLVVSALGMFIVASADSVAMFTIGICVFGFGWCTVIPMFNFEAANATNKAGLAMIASLLWAFANVGNFLSSYWLMFVYGVTGADQLAPTAADMSTPLVVGAVIFIVLAVVWAIVNISSKAWKTDTAEKEAE